MKINENKKAIICASIALLVGFGGGFSLGKINLFNAKESVNISDVYVESEPQVSQSNKDTNTVNESFADTAPSSPTIKFNYIDTSEFQNCLTDGIYRCGTDFEEGDYYILSLYSNNANYDISNSLDEFDYERRIIRAVHANKGQYVKLDGALLIHKEDFNPTDWSKYGVFVVGKDITAGDYKIEPIVDEYKNSQYNINVSGNTGAYQITESDIVGSIVDCDFLHEKQSYLTLHSGEVLMINNATLTLIQD